MPQMWLHVRQESQPFFLSASPWLRPKHELARPAHSHMHGASPSGVFPSHPPAQPCIASPLALQPSYRTHLWVGVEQVGERDAKLDCNVCAPQPRPPRQVSSHDQAGKHTHRKALGSFGVGLGRGHISPIWAARQPPMVMIVVR